MNPETITVQTKPWYFSKTIWVGIITAIVGVISMLGAQYPEMGIFVTITGVLNIVLRSISTTVIG